MPDRFVHDESFVEAFSNKTHTVLGKRLFPYSLWHQFNLEISQSALLLGAPLTPLDLLRAVRICSSRWNWEFNTPNLRSPGLIRGMWEVGRFNLREEVLKFEAYFRDYHSAPKFWPNEHKGKTGGVRDVDEVLETATQLETKGYPSEEVWNMPIGVAKWRSAVISKLEGSDLQFWTPLDEDAFRKHKAKREAAIDARAKEISQAEGILYADARKKAIAERTARVKGTYGKQSKQPK